MFHQSAARLSTWAFHTKAALRNRLTTQDDTGLEALEVVVLSAIGLVVAAGLAYAIQALVENYQNDLTKL